MKNTDFNIVKTLKLINKEPLLSETFKEDYPDFNHMNYKKKAEDDTLPKDVSDYIEDIFNSIIKNREEFLSEYEEIQVVEKTPRRYGKVQVLKDIEEQGGVADDNQLTALAINRMKSLYINLQGKCTSDRYKGTNKITPAEAKIIRAAILTLEKKITPITKKK